MSMSTRPLIDPIGFIIPPAYVALLPVTIALLADCWISIYKDAAGQCLFKPMHHGAGKGIYSFLPPSLRFTPIPSSSIPTVHFTVAQRAEPEDLKTTEPPRARPPLWFQKNFHVGCNLWQKCQISHNDFTMQHRNSQFSRERRTVAWISFVLVETRKR